MEVTLEVNHTRKKTSNGKEITEEPCLISLVTYDVTSGDMQRYILSVKEGLTVGVRNVTQYFVDQTVPIVHPLASVNHGKMNCSSR